MTFEDTYVNANGRTSRSQFIAALAIILALTFLYAWFIRSRNGQWCTLVLLAPAIVLHARRLHDMGKSALLLLIPGALIAASLWLRMVATGTPAEVGATVAAIVVSAGFAVWGAVAGGQGEANRFGEPVAA